MRWPCSHPSWISVQGLLEPVIANLVAESSRNAFSHFWRPEVWNEPPSPQSWCGQAVLPPEALGEAASASCRFCWPLGLPWLGVLMSLDDRGLPAAAYPLTP